MRLNVWDIWAPQAKVARWMMTCGWFSWTAGITMKSVHKCSEISWLAWCHLLRQSQAATMLCWHRARCAGWQWCLPTVALSAALPGHWLGVTVEAAMVMATALAQAPALATMATMMTILKHEQSLKMAKVI